jgi:hypothetical protein
VLGLAPSGALAWLSVSSLGATGPIALQPLAFTVALLAAAVDVVAWIAAGLLAGALLPARLAAAGALVFVAALLLVATLADASAGYLPVGGVTLLAELTTAARPLAEGVRAIGVSLIAVAALSLGGMAVLSRRDL